MYTNYNFFKNNVIFIEKVRSLRKVHAEKLRQIKTSKKKSGSAPKSVKWQFFKAMEFLLGETSDAGPVDSIVIFLNPKTKI